MGGAQKIEKKKSMTTLQVDAFWPPLLLLYPIYILTFNYHISHLNLALVYIYVRSEKRISRTAFSLSPFCPAAISTGLAIYVYVCTHTRVQLNSH